MLAEKIGGRERDLENPPSDTYLGEGTEDAAEKAQKLVPVFSSCSPIATKAWAGPHSAHVYGQMLFWVFLELYFWMTLKQYLTFNI